MHRSARIVAMACVLVLAGSISVGAAEATVEPAMEPIMAEPELVAKGGFSGVDLALDPDGHRHIVSSDVLGTGDWPQGDLWYATDRDGTWSTQKLLSGDGKGRGWDDASIDVDADGSVHIAVVHDHLGSTPGQTEGIYYLTDKRRQPGDFGTPVRVARKNMTDPSLAVVDGVRYLAYSKIGLPGDPPPPSPVFVKTDHSGSWVNHRLADFGYKPVLGADPARRAHVVFVGDVKGTHDQDLRYVELDPETGEPSRPVRIPGSRNVWYWPALAVDPSGAPHVAWENEKDIVWSRRTADGWSEPETVGTKRREAWSLAVDSFGQPHVVVLGRSDAGRGFIHAHRRAGTWTQSVIAKAVGWTSLASAMSGSDLLVAWAPAGARGGLWSLGGPPPGIDATALEWHAALEDLLASVPEGDCTPFTEQGDNDPFSYGARAAIQCPKPARGIQQLALFRFPDIESMTEYWDWRVGQIEPAPAWRDGACADGRRGESAWEHGELVCYVSGSPRQAKLRWIDERTDTYGVLDASDRNIARLHAAWKALTGEGEAGGGSAG